MSEYEGIISGLKGNLEYLSACGIREIPVLRSTALKAGESSRCEGCALKGGVPAPCVGASAPEVAIVLGSPAGGAGGPFSGEDGALLEKIITDGLRYKKDEVAVCYAVRCHAGEGGETTARAVASCSGLLMEDIGRLSPKAVIAMGPVAALSLAGSPEVKDLRARLIERHGFKIMVTHGPDVLVKMPGLKKDAWEDIKIVLSLLGRHKGRAAPDVPRR